MIKHEGVEYKRAVQFAQLVLDLLAKAKKTVKGVLDAADVSSCVFVCMYVYMKWQMSDRPSIKPTCNRKNEMESLRLKTRDYELLAGQSGAYTLVVIQQGQAPYVQ